MFKMFECSLQRSNYWYKNVETNCPSIENGRIVLCSYSGKMYSSLYEWTRPTHQNGCLKKINRMYLYFVNGYVNVMKV